MGSCINKGWTFWNCTNIFVNLGLEKRHCLHSKYMSIFVYFIEIYVKNKEIDLSQDICKLYHKIWQNDSTTWESTHKFMFSNDFLIRYWQRAFAFLITDALNTYFCFEDLCIFLWILSCYTAFTILDRFSFNFLLLETRDSEPHSDVFPVDGDIEGKSRNRFALWQSWEQNLSIFLYTIFL